MSIRRTGRVLSVRHWNDSLFGFETTRDSALRREMRILLLIAVLAIVAWASPSASAQGWGFGRQGWGGGWNKLEMCQGCHDMGMQGGMGMPMSRGDTAPKLGGQHAVYLGKALKAYRSGERRHPVMNRMASMLTDRDIADIARFYVQPE